MPASETALEVLVWLIRIIFELLIQGTGYALLKALFPDREPGDIAATLVGLSAWIAAVALALWIF